MFVAFNIRSWLLSFPLHLRPSFSSSSSSTSRTDLLTLPPSTLIRSSPLPSKPTDPPLLPPKLITKGDTQGRLPFIAPLLPHPTSRLLLPPLLILKPSGSLPVSSRPTDPPFSRKPKPTSSPPAPIPLLPHPLANNPVTSPNLDLTSSLTHPVPPLLPTSRPTPASGDEPSSKLNSPLSLLLLPTTLLLDLDTHPTPTRPLPALTSLF
jgi:hypothetical protein